MRPTRGREEKRPLITSVLLLQNLCAETEKLCRELIRQLLLKYLLKYTVIQTDCETLLFTHKMRIKPPRQQRGGTRRPQQNYPTLEEARGVKYLQ